MGVINGSRISGRAKLVDAVSVVVAGASPRRAGLGRRAERCDRSIYTYTTENRKERLTKI